MKRISIIVPTYNEEGNIFPLVQRIDKALSANEISYEILFIDDRSTDKTRTQITSLTKKYPITLYRKLGDQGKAQSLIEGFNYAHYENVAMLDADLQYPPEALPKMLDKISKGADMVVANRVTKQTNFVRTFISTSYSFLFNKLLHGLDFDVQAGMKVFRKEIIDRVHLTSGKWALDLELLLNAKDLGYTIVSHDIVFAKRDAGDAKINLFKASWEIGCNAIKMKYYRSDFFHHKVKHVYS
jgi:dolichol-phosphate mannosyltransferase